MRQSGNWVHSIVALSENRLFFFQVCHWVIHQEGQPDRLVESRTWLRYQLPWLGWSLWSFQECIKPQSLTDNVSERIWHALLAIEHPDISKVINHVKISWEDVFGYHSGHDKVLIYRIDHAKIFSVFDCIKLPHVQYGQIFQNWWH